MKEALLLMLVTVAILQPVRSYHEEANAEAYRQPFAESYYDSEEANAESYYDSEEANAEAYRDRQPFAESDYDSDLQELYNNGEFNLNINKECIII